MIVGFWIVGKDNDPKCFSNMDDFSTLATLKMFALNAKMAYYEVLFLVVPNVIFNRLYL